MKVNISTIFTTKEKRHRSGPICRDHYYIENATVNSIFYLFHYLFFSRKGYHSSLQKKQQLLQTRRSTNKQKNIYYRYHPQLAKQKLSFQQTCEMLLLVESREISAEIKQKHYSKYSLTAD